MTRDEFHHHMATLRGYFSVEERQAAADAVEIAFTVYLEMLGPLAVCGPAALRAKAQDLQRIDRESWAIGKMAELACSVLDSSDST